MMLFEDAVQKTLDDLNQVHLLHNFDFQVYTDDVRTMLGSTADFNDYLVGLAVVNFIHFHKEEVLEQRGSNCEGCGVRHEDGSCDCSPANRGW